MRPTFRSIDGAQAPDRVAADLAAAIEAARQRRRRGSARVIVCRSAAELERMREAGRLVGEVLTELAAHVAPGVTTADLDELAEKRIREAGATPAFKGYHGYPATICASINEEVIHGIPVGPPVAERGRRHLDRRRRLARRLLRRQRDHAGGRPGVGRSGDAAAGHRRVALQGDRRGEAGRAGVGHRPRGAEARRGLRVFGRARVRRARHRAEDARRAAGAELRRAGARAAADRGHGARDRADGERRASRR